MNFQNYLSMRPKNIEIVFSVYLHHLSNNAHQLNFLRVSFPICRKQEMEHTLDMRELGEFVGLVGYILQQESELIFRRNHV